MEMCARCGQAPGDMFANDGAPVCKGCYYTADANARTSAGAQQLVFGGIAGIVLGVLVIPVAFVSARLGGVLIATLLGGGIVALKQGLALKRKGY
ncbi:MAG: hypothetical protein JNM74_15280 [Myxococcales bacterium]|nr:hypothetical protein [Myxococcales bacterium]